VPLPCVLRVRVRVRVLVSGFAHPSTASRTRQQNDWGGITGNDENLSASPPRAAGLPPRVRAPRTHDAGRAGRAGGRAGGAGGAGWLHLRPRRGPANSLSAVRVRGRRAVVKDIGVRMPNQ